MNSYFQKITARSGGTENGHSKTAPVILPGNSPLRQVMDDDFPDDINLPTETPEHPPSPAEPSPINIKPAEKVPADNLIQPISYHKNSEGPATKDLLAKGQPKLLPDNLQEDKSNSSKSVNETNYAHRTEQLIQPSLSLSEKINQRNTFNKNETVIIEKNLITENGDEGSGGPTAAGGIEPVVDNTPEEKPVELIIGKKEEIKDKRDTKQFEPVDITKKIKEFLNPAQDLSQVNAPVKLQNENKLVIGRITVEIINPQPTVKTKEIPARESDTGKNSASEFTGINKLSFGLGQL